MLPSPSASSWSWERTRRGGLSKLELVYCVWEGSGYGFGVEGMWSRGREPFKGSVPLDPSVYSPPQGRWCCEEWKEGGALVERRLLL